MADNPFESMLPYQQMSAYKTRVLEIARLMMEHQRGITLQDVADKLQQEMEVKIKSLFQLHRSPDLVSSKFLYLWTWASCLKLYNPGESPSFLASSRGRYLPTRFLPRRSSQLPPGERAQVRVIEPVGLPSGPLDRVQSIPRSSNPRGTSTSHQAGVAGHQEQGRRGSPASGRDTNPKQRHPKAKLQQAQRFQHSRFSGRHQAPGQ